MKEKFLITSLAAATAADIGTTMIAINQGMAEKGFYAGGAFERGDATSAYIVRIAATAIIISLYALSKENKGRWEFSIDKAARITNVLAWGYAALNAVQISGILK